MAELAIRLPDPNPGASSLDVLARLGTAQLEAMGVDAQRSLRVSVGWSSTVEDVDRFLDALPRVLDGLRSLRA